MVIFQYLNFLTSSAKSLFFSKLKESKIFHLNNLFCFTRFHIHGFPPVIYLALNHRIRHDCRMMFYKVFLPKKIQKLHGVTVMVVPGPVSIPLETWKLKKMAPGSSRILFAMKISEILLENDIIMNNIVKFFSSIVFSVLFIPNIFSKKNFLVSFFTKIRF